MLQFDSAPEQLVAQVFVWAQLVLQVCEFAQPTLQLAASWQDKSQEACWPVQVGLHVPPQFESDSQLPVAVQVKPLPQGFPGWLSVTRHAFSASSQTWSLHTSAPQGLADPSHSPLLQASNAVQNLPSSQALPFGAWVVVQPIPGAQMPLLQLDVACS